MVDQIVGEMSFEPREEHKNFFNGEKMSKKKETNIEKDIVRVILRSAYIRECAEQVVEEYDFEVLIGKPGFEGQAALSISRLREALKGFITESFPGEFIDEFNS